LDTDEQNMVPVRFKFVNFGISHPKKVWSPVPFVSAVSTYDAKSAPLKFNSPRYGMVQLAKVLYPVDAELLPISLLWNIKLDKFMVRTSQLFIMLLAKLAFPPTYLT
jgi:hypothetical protein